MTQTANPLAEYFRTPEVQQVLPTGGRFFREDEIKLSMSGEIAVYPMTATDDIIIKNPDALLNGDAVERLIKSCVPDIKEPRKISIPDLDVLILAIRKASSGDVLPVNVKCPNCGNEFEFNASIQEILDRALPVTEEDCIVRLDAEVVVYLQPYDFMCKTKLDLAAFEETKLLQHLLSAETSDEEKARLFNKSFEKIAELNLDLVSYCIRSIQIPSGPVTDQAFIREFIRKAKKDKIRKIQDGIKHLSSLGIDRKMKINCPGQITKKDDDGNARVSDCKHEWETELVFDPSNFFD